MSKFPFTERHIKGNSFLREFRSSVDSEELVWHQDREDRVVKVVESGGWMLQMDNNLPVLLEEGESYNIPSLSFHRVIKGSGDLKIIVEKKNHNKIFNKKRDPYEERSTTLLETADSVLLDAVRMNEDEEQRKLRAKPEPENLLSVIYKKFNEKWGRPIPYFGSKTVKIYRGISPQAPKTLRPGDWVALKSSYAKEHGGEGSVVVSREVPAEHVTWAGTDENEWLYTPHESVVESSPGSLSEPEKGNVGEQAEPYQKMARKRFEKMMRLTIKGGNKYKTKGMKTIVPKVGKSAPPGE